MSVVNFIKDWLQEIVIVSIFISIIELSLPKGNMKKYIDMVAGLLIIYTIISPFGKLLNLNLNLHKEVFNNINSEISYMNENSNFLFQQDEQVTSLYKEKLENDMTYLIEQKTNYIVSNISIEVDQNKENFGNILSVSLEVNDKGEEVNKHRQIVIDEINIKKIGERSSLEVSSDELYKNDEIKDLISKEYSLEKEKIIITKKLKGKG